MHPSELINISLQYDIEIEASTHIPKHEFLTFSLCECHPLFIQRVPLYVAIYLQKSNQCTIRIPAYLSQKYVEDIIEKEKTSRGFIELPEYFYEHAQLFMIRELEPLILELKRLRQEKIWKGLNEIDGKALYVYGLTKWEFNEVKSMITEGMKIGKEIELREGS